MNKTILILFLWINFLGYGQNKMPTKIFLIRHTETIDDGTRDPDISEKGMTRAKKWATVLQAEKINTVYSTNLKRTQYLARTIADSQHIEHVISYKRDMNIDEFLNEIKGKSVVVTSHSNTIPFFVNKIIGKEKYKQIEDSDYSSLFIINYYSKEKVSEILLKIN